MDLERLKSRIGRTWDDSIIERLVAYVRIPNKSPMFDPQWERNGYMEAAVELMADWCRAQKVPGARTEVRRLGYRVVVVPETWIHHLLPSTFRGILRQYYRNGMGAAYVRKFYPQWVIEQAEAHNEPVGERTSLPARALRYLGRTGRAVRRGQWVYLGTLGAYALGYAWGITTLREDSL